MSLEKNSGMTLTGKTEELGQKTSPNATLSTTNPMQLDLGTNLGLRGERPVTNHLSHGTASRHSINKCNLKAMYQYQMTYQMS
jgi:hypothetical protein